MYIVYGASFCGWCKQAKELLESKGVSFTYVDIQKEDWSEIAEKNNFKTIPQIFKDGVHLGGFQELVKEFE